MFPFAQLLRVWHKLRMANTLDEVMDWLKELRLLSEDWPQRPWNGAGMFQEESPRFPGQLFGSGWLCCDLKFVRNSARSFLMMDKTWARGEENIWHASKKSHVISGVSGGGFVYWEKMTRKLTKERCAGISPCLHLCNYPLNIASFCPQYKSAGDGQEPLQTYTKLQVFPPSTRPCLSESGSRPHAFMPHPPVTTVHPRELCQESQTSLGHPQTYFPLGFGPFSINNTLINFIKWIPPALFS